jgi:hypothetical protein
MLCDTFSQCPTHWCVISVSNHGDNPEPVCVHFNQLEHFYWVGTFFLKAQLNWLWIRAIYKMSLSGLNPFRHSWSGRMFIIVFQVVATSTNVFKLASSILNNKIIKKRKRPSLTGMEADCQCPYHRTRCCGCSSNIIIKVFKKPLLGDYCRRDWRCRAWFYRVDGRTCNLLIRK